jgi:hypothetical protein
MIRLVGVAGLMAITGCAVAPSAVDIVNADFGSPMSQSECERIAKEQILPMLKDPGSAQMSFGRCEKRSLYSIPIAGVPIQHGYFTVANVNSKNSFGGYTGAQPWEVLMKNGRAIRRTYPTDGMQLPY